MEKQGVNRKVIKLIKMTLAKVENAVRIVGRRSRKLWSQRRPKAGEFLVIRAFKVITGANINRVGLLDHNRQQSLAFSHDIVILTRSRKELQEVGKRLEKVQRRWGYK